MSGNSQRQTLWGFAGAGAAEPSRRACFVGNDFDLERVVEYPVRGFNDPIELFAYHG
jgi:hypothetical protein